jgi:hypothetical protein
VVLFLIIISLPNFKKIRKIFKKERNSIYRSLSVEIFEESRVVFEASTVSIDFAEFPQIPQPQICG